MNINHLIEFIYLAETLSFRKTADYFYVSRSVISRHLASLEETLGVKLLDRGNQAVQLTEAGKVFYREAQSVLRAYAHAIDSTRKAGNSQGRMVRIGYLKNAARPVIVRFVRYMNHEHPDIQLETTCMEYGDLRRALEEGTVDVALGVNVNPEISHNYRLTPIYTDKFFAVMSKDHALANRTEGVDISELPQERLLMPDSFVFAGLSELIDEIVERDPQIKARTYYSDVDMLYLKVQTEGYVAFSSGLNSVMFGNQLAIVPILGVDPSFSVSAFYRDDLSDELYRACCKGFESCHEALKTWDPSKGDDVIGISMASYR